MRKETETPFLRFWRGLVNISALYRVDEPKVGEAYRSWQQSGPHTRKFVISYAN